MECKKGFLKVAQVRLRLHHSLDGGFKYLLFSPLLEEMIQFD